MTARPWSLASCNLGSSAVSPRRRRREKVLHPPNEKARSAGRSRAEAVQSEVRSPLVAQPAFPAWLPYATCSCGSEEARPF